MNLHYIKGYIVLYWNMCNLNLNNNLWLILVLYCWPKALCFKFTFMNWNGRDASIYRPSCVVAHRIWIYGYYVKDRGICNICTCKYRAICVMMALINTIYNAFLVLVCCCLARFCRQITRSDGGAPISSVSLKSFRAYMHVFYALARVDRNYAESENI